MDQPSRTALKDAVRYIKHRAEENPFSYSDIFVDTNILSRISSEVNQVIYGRRGMGKTHLLGTLSEQYQKGFGKKKILPIFIDLRPVHNKASVREEDERAYALIAYREFLESIVKSIEKFIKDTITVSIFDRIWGGQRKQKLDNVDTLLKDIKTLIQTGEPVVESGNVESKIVDEHGKTRSSEAGLDLGLKSTSENIMSYEGGAHIGLKKGSSHKTEETMNIIYKGLIVYDLGRIGKDLDDIISELELDSVAILLDEWSSIKMEYQPFLAEMIKTTIISGRKRKIFVKFSCIGFRTRLSLRKSSRHEIGFHKSELSQSLDLDKYYTSYIEPPERIAQFLFEVLCKHLSASLKEFKDAEYTDIFYYIVNNLFANDGGIPELVNVSSGIPREFLIIFSMSFLQSEESLPIRVETIRQCAGEFFWEKTDQENEEAKTLFEEIYDYVKEKSYVFFVSRKYVGYHILQELWDNRWIHLIHKGTIAYANREEGVYDVYKIDAARYITKRATSKGETSYQAMRIVANTVKKLCGLSSALDGVWKPKYDEKIIRWFSKVYARQIEIPEVEVDKLSEDCSSIVVDKIIQSHSGAAERLVSSSMN